MIDESWKLFLNSEFQKPYFKQLSDFTLRERQTKIIYPAHEDVFNAFTIPFEQVKVVILGQDPYHGFGQAHGLCFSVKPGVPIPPSLRNIYIELEDDLKIKPATHGCLTKWINQGIFLLNTILTVRSGEPGSHKDKGWETLTDSVIRRLNARPEPLVFVLWGQNAQRKLMQIDIDRHTIIKSSHPSPMSASNGFFGSKPFSKINQGLVKQGLDPVDWKL